MPSLYLTDQIRRAEAQAQAGLAPLALMRRAAMALSDVCATEVRKLPPDCSIVALVGPGNNGGDALLAAVSLRERGFNAQALLLRPEGSAQPDAREALAISRAGSLPCIDELPISSVTRTLFIDGLFGIGLSRPIEGHAADWINALNGYGARVIAVDVPSGINADTGEVVGGSRGVALRAGHTVTFLGDKPGLRTGPGRTHAGRLTVESLGVTLTSRSGTLVGEQEAKSLALPLARRPDSHKGSFGHVAVVGGAHGMRGAAVLAALGAQRSGAGKVSLGAPDAWRPDSSLHPQLMALPAKAMVEGAYQCWVIGCGLGQTSGARSLLKLLLTETEHHRVLDADALNLIASDRALAAALQRAVIPAVLTPHPLEAARLLGKSTQAIQSDRIGAACRIASLYRSVVLLKGAGTVCAHPGGDWAIIDAGSPSLATAGTGDVLAGVIGGLIAQGLNPASAACLGAYAHGRAGELAGADGNGVVGMASADLPESVAMVINQLIESDTGLSS